MVNVASNNTLGKTAWRDILNIFSKKKLSDISYEGKRREKRRIYSSLIITSFVHKEMIPGAPYRQEELQ